jgi:hypothetical protein
MSGELSLMEPQAALFEDSINYRIEWDDRLSSTREIFDKGGKIVHYGSGSIEVSSYDNAKDIFYDCRDDMDFIGVRLIKINHDGNESIYDF